MKKIIVIVGWLFITACGVKTKLSQDDLQWVDYKPQDMLVFKSNKGNADTIVITERRVYYPDYNPIELHDKYLPQMATVKAKRYGTDEFTFVELEKRKPDKSVKWMIQIRDYAFFHDDIVEQLVDTNQIFFRKPAKWKVSLSINAQNNFKLTLHVAKVYLSSDYQILAYEMSDGELYERVK